MPLATLNRFQVQSILRHLDAAAAALPRSRYGESQAAWNLRMARERFYAAAIADVAVEIAEAA